VICSWFYFTGYVCAFKSELDTTPRRQSRQEVFLQAACIARGGDRDSTMRTFKERSAWAISSCRKAQMRLTPVREAILAFLAQQRLPATLEMILQADNVRGKRDETTVYRTLMMFKEAELVRVVGTPRKASSFVLNAPGDSANFLICRRCGCITELLLPRPMAAEIARLVSARGFSPKQQICEILGLCASCQVESNNQIVPSKLIVRVVDKMASSKRDSAVLPGNKRVER